MAITQKKSWFSSSAPLTKLSPPRLGNIYVRERLVQQLDTARAQYAVVWIVAPAGAGKTTLVASYLQQRGLNALWYQVDTGDQDIASFYYYFGLATKQSGARKKLPLFTPEYQRGLPAFTRNWFRALFAQRAAPNVLVLDNYQEVGDAAALHTVLQHAADELPAGVNLVVISRAQPPAELARLSAANAIANLGWDQLQLTAAESAALVQTLSADAATTPPLGSAALQRLHQRTQGWITGVVLGVRRGILTAVDDEPPNLTLDTFADRTQLFDYFAAEVLARTDQSTREFLYAAALLPTMTVALCEALTQHRDAKTVLRRLERDSFFTTRRGILSASYEFHPLFRQFLLAQGEAHLNTDRLQTLRRSAGQLLAAAGESEHAVALLAATQDWSTVSELIKTHGAELEKQGRLQTLQQWIAALPESERSADPWLLYWSGIAKLPTDPFAAYESFERAYPQFSDKDDVLGLYLCWIGAAMALFFRHDDMNPAPGWIAELERLRVRHPKWPSLEVQGRVTTTAVGMLTMGDPQNPALPEWVERAEKIYRYVPSGTVRCFVGYQLAMYYSFFGRVDKMSVIAEQLKPLVASPKIPDIARTLANVVSVFTGWHTGNRAVVNEAIAVGLKLLESSGVYVTSQWFYASAAIAKMTFAEGDEAAEFVERLRENNNPRHRMELSFIEFMTGWRALLRGELVAANARTESGLALIEPLHHMFFLTQALTARAQVLIEVGEFADARTMLDRLRRLSEESKNRLFSEYVCHYLEAYLLDKSGGSLNETLQSLQRSFSVGAKHQWIAMVFWQPTLITRLCTLALQHNIEPDYTKRLIRIYHLTPAETGELIEAWPYPIKIYTLGRFAIVVDDATLAFEGRAHKKTLDLLKALIACGGREVSEQRLCDALWPDAEADDARNNFKITLHRLRKLLGHDVIQLSESKLTLDPARCWVDVWALERSLNHLTAPTSAGVTTSELQRQGEQALRLYHGSFLHSEDASFVITLRERLRSKLVRAIAHIAEHLQNDAQHELAQRWYERGIEIEPLVEAFYQGFMRTCQALQRPAAGLAAYDRCCAVLAAQLHVAPSPTTEALRKALRG